MRVIVKQSSIFEYLRAETEKFSGGIMSSPLIYLQDVNKIYSTNSQPIKVLRHVNLSIAAGEFVGIIGPSGSGKSTLLHLVAGIDRPSSGQVIVAGQHLNSLGEDELARWRGRTVGIVFQFFHLLPTLTVLENVLLAMDFGHVIPPRQRRERAIDLLHLVGMGNQAHKLPAELSGGEQQRVAIARALANDPPILLADEPTGNLDSQSGQAVFALFTNLITLGKTVLMVTHDPALGELIPRKVGLLDGQLIEPITSLEDLLARRLSGALEEQAR